MPSNYGDIEQANRARYGWDIKRIGKMLLADRYTDRTHFIFELLQNAEDAIHWRPPGPKFSKSVSFNLTADALQFSHFGLPFETRHVESICGIGESTKVDDLTSIGRFGIGFKSVYTFSNRPEIHSGDENFAIEEYVRPTSVAPRQTVKDQTLFHIPFDENDKPAFSQILDRLRSLGHRSLLFLKHIETIEWTATDAGGGTYLREAKSIAANVTKVTLVGQQFGSTHTTMEKWLVFSREVQHENKPAGRVEIAYSIYEDPKSKGELIRPITDSELVVFFPTEKATNLGFLIQGPYRTTPSRDNVPKDDAWNRHLISETAILVQDTLRKLKDMKMLTTEVLHALPIDATKFSDNMFSPIFRAVKKSLLEEELLPKYDGGFTSGKTAKIARTDGLRKLINSAQLGQLHGLNSDLVWLTDEITRDKTALLRDYLMQELSINEVDPDAFQTRFSETFIKNQADDWVASLYVFLLDQPALWRIAGLRIKPIIRLESGVHVSPFDANGRPRAFLPTAAQSGFPLVKKTVCQDQLALKFLTQLGLTEPDPVDDVIVNILPQFFNSKDLLLAEIEYTKAMARILNAFQTDSTSQKKKLIESLLLTPFVRARNAETGTIENRLPGQVYLASEKLKTLFQGNPEIWLADDSCQSLKGESVRKLLETCGTRDYLRNIRVDYDWDWDELKALRIAKGCTNCSRQSADDYEVVGLQTSVQKISKLTVNESELAALNLWQVLLDTLREARENFFLGKYEWGYYHDDWSATFPSKFLKRLRKASWIPVKDGGLKPPAEICFSQLAASIQALPNAILQELLGFKPEVILQLAAEAGIDPATLDLLKKHDITTAKLMELLQKAGVESKPEPVADAEMKPNVANEAEPDDESPESEQSEAEPLDSPSSQDLSNGNGQGGDGYNHSAQPSSRRKNPNPDHTQDGEFVTYIYTHPADIDEASGDSIEHERRKKLGQEGLEAVLEFERKAGRQPEAMSQTNEGFDVTSRNSQGITERRIEVKTLGATWGPLGVTLSEPQFRMAESLEDMFWLYVVEDVGKSTQRIHRIQNPARRIKNYAFNQGWRALGEPDQ